jgi:hypothetical protein
MRRAKEPAGLSGWIDSPEIKPMDVMEIWKRMTPEEKQTNRWKVVSRIAKHKPSFDFTAQNKMDALKQISGDMEEKP